MNLRQKVPSNGKRAEIGKRPKCGVDMDAVPLYLEAQSVWEKKKKHLVGETFLEYTAIKFSKGS